MATVLFPYMYIPDPEKGRPLANANIFIGKPGLDPQIEANRIQVFEIQTDGTPIAIAQPIVTTGGGVPMNCCSPAVLSVDENEYSIKITDKFGAQKYFQEFVSGFVAFDEVRNAAGIYDSLTGDATSAVNDEAILVGDFISTVEYHFGSKKGGGQYQKVAVDPGEILINPASTDGNWLKLEEGETKDPSQVEITYARAPNISTPKEPLPSVNGPQQPARRSKNPSRQ